MRNTNRKYYEAYEERYKTVHGKGIRWSSSQNTPIVMKVLQCYGIPRDGSLLEIGCGEGRDSGAVLDAGYNLMSTDVSGEAIAYCKRIMPEYSDHFCLMDCLIENPDMMFDFIFAVAVVHMLVLDEDRQRFYQFIHDHLNENGLALILTMGDGELEMQSNIDQAFDLQVRDHETGKMMVAATSCRMVSFETFEYELKRSSLNIVEKGITTAQPDFNSMMYAVVKRTIYS